MPMMEVRVVGMAVDEFNVRVAMCMRLAGRIRATMPVPMMVVVTMPVFVLEGPVCMFVIVPFGQVQPESRAHQPRSGDQSRGNRLVQQDDGEQRSHERSQRKIGGRPRRPQVAQREDEQREAHAIPEEPGQRGGREDTGRGQ
jgi:hypothetical protein